MGFCVCHSHFWSPGCPSGESSTPAHLFRALSRVLNFVAVWKNSTVCIFNKGTAWMVNRCVVLGWLNIKGRVFVPVHRTVNHRWPDMTPGKSITAQDCIGLLSERVCAHVCVCMDCPLLHHTVIKAEIGCRGVSRALCVCVCVSLLWGSLWVYCELYMSKSVSCPALTCLCTYSQPRTTFSVSLWDSSLPGAMTGSLVNPLGCTAGGKTQREGEKMDGEIQGEQNIERETDIHF